MAESSPRRSPRSSKGVPSQFLQENYELGFSMRRSSSDTHPSTDDHKKSDEKGKSTAVAADSSIPSSTNFNDLVPLVSRRTSQLLGGDEASTSAKDFIDKAMWPLRKTPSASSRQESNIETIHEKPKPPSSGEKLPIESYPQRVLRSGRRLHLDAGGSTDSNFDVQKESRAELAFARLRDPTNKCRLCLTEFQDPHQLRFSRWLGWRLCKRCYDQYGTHNFCCRAPPEAPWKLKAEQRAYEVHKFTTLKQLPPRQVESQEAHGVPTNYLLTDQDLEMDDGLNAMDWPSADIFADAAPWGHSLPVLQSNPSTSEAQNEEMALVNVFSENPLADYNQWKRNNPNPPSEEALQRHRQYLDDVERLPEQQIQSWNFGNEGANIQDSNPEI